MILEERHVPYDQRYVFDGRCNPFRVAGLWGP
jgi:hypothetical protein